MATTLPPRNENDSIEAGIREFGFGHKPLTAADIEASRIQQAHWTVERLTARVDFLRDNLAELEEQRAKYGSMLGPSIADLRTAKAELDKAVSELTDARLYLAGKAVAA